MSDNTAKKMTWIISVFGMMILGAIFWSGSLFATVQENKERSLKCIEKVDNAATKDDLHQLEENMKFFIEQIIINK